MARPSSRITPAVAYASHLEATATCAIRSGILWPNSPILELGCGDFSTPVLASITRAQRRRYKIISSDPDWADRYTYLAAAGVKSQIIDKSDWPRVDFGSGWGMVLVDNEQLVRDRFKQLIRLAGKAQLVLLHDADVIERRRIPWDPVLAHYPFFYMFRRRRPYTAIFSAGVDPKPWFECPDCGDHSP